MKVEKNKAFIAKIQNDPVFHVEQIQGVGTLEEYQKRIIKALVQYDRVAISACHSIGKTFTVAKIVLWFLTVYKNSRVITTAPSHDQVKRLLWSEIRNGLKNSTYPLGGRILDTEWKIDDMWFAFGVSPKDETGEAQGGSTFQGHHSDHMLIVFDEATGIGKTRWIQAEGMLTSSGAKIITIGNPTSKQSEFFKCFSNPSWHKIYLSCFDSPNLIDNGIKDLQSLRDEVACYGALTDKQKLDRLKTYKIPHKKLITSQWVIGRALDWGVDHPLFQSRVLGIFPDDDETSLIPMGLVEIAQNRDPIAVKDKISIGVDPARYGTDKTVITVIEGDEVTRRIEIAKADTMEVAGAVINVINGMTRVKHEIISVDATGIGAGVFDALKQAKRDKIIRQTIILREVHFGAGCPDDGNKYFANLKAKLFVDLRDAIKKHNLVLNDDNVWMQELPQIRYSFDSKGRFVMESKDGFKKRTGSSSPDSADSLAIAYGGLSFGGEVGSFLDLEEFYDAPNLDLDQEW